MAIQPSVNHPINCGMAATPSFARQFIKRPVAERTADLDLYLEYALISSGSSAPATIGDINYTRNTYPTSATNVRALVSYMPEKFAAVNSLVSGDPAVLANPTIDPSVFEYVSTGITAITVTFSTNEKITKTVSTATLAESATQDVFQSFLPGSLGRHMYEQIRIYADGSTSPPNHYPLYATFDQVSNSYSKSNASWASDLDFSGVTVNKAGSSGITTVTAISPYHAVGVAHYAPAQGDVLYFCDSNNQTVSRVVHSTSVVSGVDCVLVRFTEALPPTVKKYKTLPATFKDYLPINRSLFGTAGNVKSYRGAYVPVIVSSHYRWDSEWPLQRANRYAYVYQTNVMTDTVNATNLLFAPANASPNNFENYNGEPSGIRGGDSGSPCFALINNDLVVLHAHVSRSGGPLFASFLNDIQSAINSLGPGGHTFQTVDLSGFTNFS